jgi:Fur family peroxide stress response transcriptional regulator
MTTEAALAFRELCTAQRLAVTHQRQVIYEVMQSMTGHPSPEEVYSEVREQIPAISLATVYKNIHLFLASGILREVSPHHGSLRIEINRKPHHHLVCTECRGIQDIGEIDLLGFSGYRPAEGNMPHGFLARRFAVDVLGICAECQKAGAARAKAMA